MEELMNNVAEAVEETMEPVMVEVSGSTGFKKLAIGGGIALATTAIGVGVRKIPKVADFLEKREVRRLEKKGYVVYKAEEDECYDSEVEETEE